MVGVDERAKMGSITFYNVEQSKQKRNFRNPWTVFIFFKLYKHFKLQIKLMNFVN